MDYIIRMFVLVCHSFTPKIKVPSTFGGSISYLVNFFLKGSNDNVVRQFNFSIATE